MTVSVDGVVYYRVQNAILAVANITNADSATRLLAQTTLRNVLGTKNLSQILSDREEIAHNMQVSVADSFCFGLLPCSFDELLFSIESASKLVIRRILNFQPSLLVILIALVFHFLCSLHSSFTPTPTLPQLL